MNKQEIITSPILYTGNKTRLIKKGLIDLFPKKINLFVDLFSGSLNVSMNTKANSYIINDIDHILHIYYKIFQTFNTKTIIQYIEKQIKQYNLPTKHTPRKTTSKEEIEKYKKAYNSFRNICNTEWNPLDIYTIMYFAYSQQYRTNQDGKLNMPMGNNTFSPNHRINIENGCNFFKNKNIVIYKTDYAELFEKINLKKEDFIYLDPPYINTIAPYNKKYKWNLEKDKKLLHICQTLHNKNIKFGLSNTLISKGIKNQPLIDLILKNNLQVYSPKNFKYSANGKIDNTQQEVFVCNYEIQNPNTNFYKINNIA